MREGLVSLLTPMYNTEQYVHRLLDSVLGQTYPDIEMIVIDDGSTDLSKEVVLSYIPRFEQRGYSLKYVYQENSGQSVAINNGLKMIHGQYLAWPDSDDFYSSSDTIEQMVTTLKTASPEFKMVRTQITVVDEFTLNPIEVWGSKAKKEENASLFEDCLLAQNGFYFCAGAYLVEVKALRETTDMEIYTSKDAGQNWQLYLPMLYKYRCQSILAPLYSCVVRSASHSRGQYRGYYSTVKKFTAYYNTQIETLKRIKGFPPERVAYYQTFLAESYDIQLFWTAFYENKRLEALRRIRPYLSKQGMYKKERRYAFFLKIKGGTYLANFLRKGVSLLKRVCNHC